MAKHTIAREAFIIVIVLFGSSNFTCLASGANLITNGDFELGNTSFTTGYTYSPSDLHTQRTYTVDSNPRNTHELFASYGDHTTGSGKMMVVNGATSAGIIVWQQSVPVSPDTNYILSLWLSSCYAANPLN